VQLEAADGSAITPNLLNQLLITLEKDEDNSRSIASNCRAT
jgi:hypothetical protein